MALEEGERCDADAAHEVVSLRHQAGRDALAARMWGGRPPRWGSLARRRRRRRRMLEPASARPPFAIAYLVAAMVVVGYLWLVWVLLTLAVAALAGVGVWLWRRRPPRLEGSATEPRRLGEVHAVGTIESDEVIPRVPGSTAPGVAWTMELWHGDELMLRDGATARFRIRAEGGDEVIGGPGRAEVIEGREVEALEPLVNIHLTLLAGTDAAIAPLFAYDHAVVRVIGAGDRIELLTALGPAVAPLTGHAGGYREIAASERPVVGVPRFRRRG